jgi:hypothetical protein
LNREKVPLVPFEVDVLIVGAAKREIGGCDVAVRYRDEAENDSARIDFGDASEPKQLSPQIIIMNAVSSSSF